MRFLQCRFRRGAEHTVAWIEERGAKPGARVELKTLDDGKAWEVETVNGAPLEAEALADLQRHNRKSLKSLARIAWT
jgi:hypothetical protein